MGAVYLARERALERAVAIKVLPPDLAADGDSRERFKREARTAAKLTHPNIVPLHTFGDVDGILYFVMGYVHGESLGERMRREGALPSDDTRRILAELAGAVDYAHRQGVIHRDIKPDNVLLDDESGRPMLTDFGVAKASASGATLTELGAVVGTPHYMSPEQASGDRNLDGRSDLYSLGVMGYAMLSGRLPFEGDSFRDVIVQHISKEPPALRLLMPDVAPDLERAVTRCLAKDPSARWHSGGSLKEALGLADDDDSLPGELREVSASLFWSGVGAWTFGSWAWFKTGSLALTIVGAVFIPSMFFLTAVVHHRKGFTWRQMFRVAKWPTKWWPFPWPQPWRRPGDVWSRLPKAVLRLRMSYGALVLVTALAVPFWLSSKQEWLTVLLGVLYGFGALGTLVTAWWAQKTGFPNNADLRSLVLGATTNKRFWRLPHVAKILRPAPPRGAAVGREPQTAAALALAIEQLAPNLSGPARELGATAVVAARQIAATLPKLDAEIAILARDASAGEIAAAEQKVMALGEEGADNASRRELRQMLTNQLGLLRRLSDQLGATMRRRERMLELLRTLWLQLANLRAEAARDTLVDADLSGRIHSVVTEISEYSAAEATLRIDPATRGA
jgi:serine/threonine protein kinase